MDTNEDRLGSKCGENRDLKLIKIKFSTVNAGSIGL